METNVNRRPLGAGQTLTLKSKERELAVTIEEFIFPGGAMCYAYIGTFVEHLSTGEAVRHRCIVKELFPHYLGNGYDGSLRNDDTSINVPDACKKRFETDVVKFRKAYTDVCGYLEHNPEAANDHPHMIGLFEANNTYYTVCNYAHGTNFSKLKLTDLLCELNYTKQVARNVRMYHKAGYLHLDIKPANVQVLENNAIKLFDFDSLTPIDYYKNTFGSVQITSPGSYGVPELDNGNVSDIGVTTDVYEIGAMLYLRIFGTAPEAIRLFKEDRLPSFTGVPILQSLSPRAGASLREFFLHTIRYAPSLRFKSVDELLTHLDELILLVQKSDTRYLMNLHKWKPAELPVGRRDELSELDFALDVKGYVFIRSMGGIGKSELTKMYTNHEAYSKKYHTVQFCRFSTSLRHTIAALSVHGIADSDYDSLDKLYEAKLQVLRESDGGTLLIIDNFNVTADPDLCSVLPCAGSFKLIFTTRCTPIGYGDHVLDLKPLSPEDCESLFLYHSGASIEEHMEYRSAYEEFAEKTIAFNTLTLVLTALAVKQTNSSAVDIFERIKRAEITDIRERVFHNYDISMVSEDDIEYYNTVFAHLSTIFSISALTTLQRTVLFNMTLVPHAGISPDRFMELCGISSLNTEIINTLADSGWIERNENGIALHPIISDLIATGSSVSADESYYLLADGLITYCSAEAPEHMDVLMKKLDHAVMLDKRLGYRFKDSAKNFGGNTDKIRVLLRKNDLAGLEYDMLMHVRQSVFDIHMGLVDRRSSKRALDAVTKLYEDGACPKKHRARIHFRSARYLERFESVADAEKSFKLAIREAERQFLHKDRNLIALSMLGIADCLRSDNRIKEAYPQYKNAYRYITRERLDHLLYSVCDALKEVCTDLDRVDEAKRYESIRDRHKPDSDDPSVFQDVITMLTEGSLDEGRRLYESALKKYAVEFGEASPQYTNATQLRWVFDTVTDRPLEAQRAIAQRTQFIEEHFGNESLEMARHLTLVAKLYPQIGSLTEAKAFADRAMSICRSIGALDSYEYHDAALSLACCLNASGKPREARELLTSIDFSDFSGNAMLSGYVSAMCTALCELGEYLDAERLSAELLTHDSINDLVRLNMLVLRASALEHMGDIAGAEGCIKTAEPYAERFSSDYLAVKRRECQFSRVKARIHYRKGEYGLASDVLTAMTDNLNGIKLPDSDLIALYLERGIYRIAAGDTAEGSADIEAAEALSEGGGVPSSIISSAYGTIAAFYIERGSIDNAERCFERIAETSPHIFTEPSTFSEAVICANRGRLAMNVGRHEDAEKLMNTARDALRRAGCSQSDSYRRILESLGLVYLLLGKYTEAVNVIEEAMHSDGAPLPFERGLALDLAYLKALFASDDVKKAMKHASKVSTETAARYGSTSLQYLNAQLTFADAMISIRSTEAESYLGKAEDVIDTLMLRGTEYEARLHNYFACYLFSVNDDRAGAVQRLNMARAALELAGVTDGALYSTVCANLSELTSCSGV